MATVAAAQVAEMQRAGRSSRGDRLRPLGGRATPPRRVSGVCELGSALLEVVFHRGKMHDIVPRDELGRSSYRLAAIRPSQIDLPDADVESFVPTRISAKTGEFLQIVNFNSAARSTRSPVRFVAWRCSRRRSNGVGKSPVAVFHPWCRASTCPFHSKVLRSASTTSVVRSARDAARQNPDLIIGRYIGTWCRDPSLWIATSFQEIRDLVPAEPLDEIFADYDTWRNEAARTVPQDRDRTAGMAVRQPGAWSKLRISSKSRAGRRSRHRNVFVEDRREDCAPPSPGWPPTPETARVRSTVEVLQLRERDAAVLFATDTDPGALKSRRRRRLLPKSCSCGGGAGSGGSGTLGATPRGHSIRRCRCDASALICRPRCGSDCSTPIETITDGASSRRSSTTGRPGVGTESGAIDGAAEADLSALKGRSQSWRAPTNPFGRCCRFD